MSCFENCRGRQKEKVKRQKNADRDPPRHRIYVFRFAFCLLLLTFFRRVVVDDAPALGEVAENQREQAAGLVAVFHLQTPMAADPGSLSAEQVNFQLRERQLAHLAASALVTCTVALQRRIPTAGHSTTGIKRKLRRAPVAAQKTLQIAAIPGCSLIIEHAADWLVSG